MNKNSIITIAIVGVGGYALYWYLNNYGPAGAVSVAGGPGSYWQSWFGTAAASTTTSPAVTTGAPSTTTSPATTTSTTTTTSPGVTASVMATPAQISQIQSLLLTSDIPAFNAMIPTLTQAQAAAMLLNAQGCAAAGTAGRPLAYSTSAGTCQVASTNLSSQLLRASGGVNSLNVSQWNYYMVNGGNGVPPIDPNGQFPALNDGGVAMDVDSYLNLRAANGLSGVGMIMPVAQSITQASTGVSGIGQIMPMSPYITPADNGVRAGGVVGMSNGGGTGGPGIDPSIGMDSTMNPGLGRITRVRSPWGQMPSRRVN